jgi:uncharacterized protein (TIGR03435 family)
MKFRSFPVLAICAIACAQDAPKPKLHFEAASIKPDASGDMRTAMMMQPGGRYVVTNITAKMLILSSFQLKENQLTGLPSWADSDRYDITAKPENGEGVTADDTRAMVRSLLEDRFKFAYHTETKEMPIYALVIAKGGPKLQPASGTKDVFDGRGGPGGLAPPPGGRGRGAMMRMGRGELSAAGATIATLADQLSRIVGRTVIDKTGLTGNYDFDLKYTDEGGAPMMMRGPGADPNAPPPPSETQTGSIFSALQEQLGLKLEAQKGPVDVYIVDHIDKPSEN